MNVENTLKLIYKKEPVDWKQAAALKIKYEKEHEISISTNKPFSQSIAEFSLHIK